MTAPTPSQTIGPFFRFGLAWLDPQVPVAGGIALHGAIFDGDGEPVPDGVVEIWQAGPCHFGRALTDEVGHYQVTAVAPRPDEHIDVSVFARGLMQRLVTRVHVVDGSWPASIPPARRHTLVARPDEVGLRFDIHLQGPEETVFFAW